MTVVRLLSARLILDVDGQDLLEYGLLAALIAVVAVTGISARSATRSTRCSGQTLVKPSDFLVIATVAGGSGTAAAIDLRHAACRIR